MSWLGVILLSCNLDCSSGERSKTWSDIIVGLLYLKHLFNVHVLPLTILLCCAVMLRNVDVMHYYVTWTFCIVFIRHLQLPIYISISLYGRAILNNQLALLPQYRLRWLLNTWTLHYIVLSVLCLLRVACTAGSRCLHYYCCLLYYTKFCLCQVAVCLILQHITIFTAPNLSHFNSIV